MNNHTTLGKQGESLVMAYLIQLGFTITHMNYRCGLGEIDIIAQKDNIISFVEVKMRMNNFVPIGHIVNHTKQQKILKTARHFLMHHAQPSYVYRFDVAYVNAQHEITYIPNAFQDQA